MWLAQRLDEPREKVVASNHVGVYKYQDFRLFGDLLEGAELIVDLLRTPRVYAGDDDSSLARSPGREFYQLLIGRIRFGSNSKDYFKLRIILIEEFLHVFTKAGIQALARQDHRGIRMITVWPSRHLSIDVAPEPDKGFGLQKSGNYCDRQ